MSVNNSKQLRIGAILSYVQTAVGAIISLVYTPVMLEALGKNEYGLYNIAATTISYVNLLNMGFSSSYVRFYSKVKASNDKEAVAKTNGLFLLVFLIIGVLALIAGLVLTFCSELIFSEGLSTQEYHIIKRIMIILTVSTSYNLATSVFSSIVIAHERFIFHRLVNLIKTIFTPSITWIMLMLGYRSIMMAAITALLTIIVDTFYLLYSLVKLRVKFNMKNPSKAQLKDITFFSGFIALSSIVDQFNWSIDKLLLGRIWGSAYTAIYSLASTIHTLFMQLSTAVSNVFIPRVNMLVATKSDKEELTNLFIMIGRVQMMVLLPVFLGFVFLGRGFIGIWAPSGYSQAYVIAVMLMGASFVPYIQNIGVSIQVAMNKHYFRSILYACIAGVNFVVSIILCRHYGAIGCAIGTVGSLVIGNGVIMNIYYHKVIGLNMVKYWKSMSEFVPAVIVLSVLGIVIMMWVPIDSWLVFLIVGAAFVITYVVTLWLTIFTDSEKEKVLRIIKK